MTIVIGAILLVLLLAFFIFGFYMRGKTIDEWAMRFNELNDENTRLVHRLSAAEDRAEDYKRMYHHVADTYEQEPTPEEMQATYRSLGLQ